MAKNKNEQRRKGIYKRCSIYWIRYAGLDGRIIRESSRQGDMPGTRIQDAERLLHERKADIGRGKQPEVRKKIPNISFKALSIDYLQWAKRQRAFKQKKTLVNQLVEIFGILPLRMFGTKLIEQYQTQRLEKGNKPATVNRHVTVIKHMLTKAVEWDLVEEEVLKRVRRAKQLEENNKRLRFLSKEECQALIDACAKHLRPIVITALNTGMRRGEILTLKWENVDLQHGFVLLDKTKNGNRREIHINETLRDTFKNITRRLDVPYVFFDPSSGSPYGDIKNAFNGACKRTKIKDFKFHDLRHTFASHLVMAGVDIVTVQQLLGHNSLTMTLRYAHLAPSHKARAVDILDNVLNKTLNCTKSALLQG